MDGNEPVGPKGPDHDPDHRRNDEDDGTTPDGTDAVGAPREAGTAGAPHVQATVSRRALLTGGGVAAGAVLLGAGVAIGHAIPGRGGEASMPTPSASPTASAAPQPSVTSYVSTALTAPAIRVWKTGATAEGYLFVGPYVDGGFHGVIVDDQGEPVWIAPGDASATSPVNMTTLGVQRYRGRPVLAYWSGKSVAAHGVGECTIMDASYRTIATVRAGAGMQADLHEFRLTDRGTALITAYPVRRADLSSVGGPANGYIYDCHAQEVDIATGAVLLDWSALDHVAVDETFLTLTQRAEQDGTTNARAFDPFHINAVDDQSDRLLVSLRHTHALYAIDRASGAVLWRFGGKHSDFRIPADAQFSWQHHARWRGTAELTLFDNHHYSGTSGQSQGLWFAVDEKARTATLKARYAYDRHMATAMGSVQPLPGGNALVGWGWDPAVTEFDATGAPVYEMTLPGRSYRAFRHPWTGTPHTRPAIAARREGDNVAVYMSWNGATEVAAWEVTSSGGTGVTTAVTPRTGFETKLLVAPTHTVTASALDEHGAVLGTTATVGV